MTTSILSPKQKDFLDFFTETPKLYSHFYFTGDTCLSEYYLKQRYSEELDFFSEDEFAPFDISVLLKNSKKKLQYIHIDFQQSFNRNIFQINFSQTQSLKVEFTYFPFTPIDSFKRVGNLRLDSLKDIAVNKTFTIHQNPRGRDFYDLYIILKTKDWSFDELLKLVRIKFDAHIDYLQLGTQLMEVKKLKDDPILVKALDLNEVKKYFLDLAHSFKNKIIQ